jgi:organic radical activating enzyme
MNALRLELPETVQIETAMACNLRCPMCPVPTAKTHMDGRKPGIMSLETFESLLEQISDKPRIIGLTMMGEPMLNKRLPVFIALGKERGHYMAMTTNGTLLDETRSRALLDAGLDMMKVSFDGATRGTYERIRIGAHFDTVISNVKAFDRLRKELGSECGLQIHCIESDLTRNEIDAFRSMWSGIADQCEILSLSDWVGQMTIPDEFGATAATASDVDDDVAPDDDVPRGCHFLWDVLSISDSGHPVYCCFDYKHQSGLPSINEKPLLETWNDEFASERRKHEANTVDSAPCAGCAYWKQIKSRKEAPRALERNV